MEKEPEPILKPTDSRELGTKDPERIRYEKEVAVIEARIRILDQEIFELEFFERRERDEEVGNADVRGETTTVAAKKVSGRNASRRNFIRTALFTLGAVLTSKSTGINDPEKIEKKPGVPSAEKKMHRGIEKTTEDEIKKCGEIIKNEQYEEIIKNPCLVSALYYSEQAVQKMAPPHQHSTEEIMWNIYPLITPKFRENYINHLKRMAEEKNKESKKINSNMQSRPLDIISAGKDLGVNHSDAIDLFIAEGSVIYTMSGGVVVLSENHWIEDNDMSTSSHRGGNTVIVFNPYDESFYRYAHMRETKVPAETVLSSGEKIGIVGHTGINASQGGHGGHLHFEINRYDRGSGKMIPLNVFDLNRKLEMLKTP